MGTLRVFCWRLQALCLFVGACFAQHLLPKVYVYDLPKGLTDDVIHGLYQQDWLKAVSYEYEADLWLHWQILNSPARTYEPDSAQLFYIPVLPTRLLHLTLSPEVGWLEAANKSGEYLWEALSIVKQQPYWAKANGRDHFLAMTADAARCVHLTALPRSVWGDISIVHHLGDLVMRGNGWPCYDPELDILLPGFLPESAAPATSVFGSERNTNVLFRFGTTGHEATHEYHSRLVRSEVRTHFESKAWSIPQSDWSKRSINDTLHDMSHSIFCVCPPGVVAHTSRFWKALRRGCIPVTFFRAYDLPFSDVIDYQAAIVNVQPDNIHTMSSVLAAILSNPAKLASLQQNVERIQRILMWESDSFSSRSGIVQLFWNALSSRTQQMY